ncbi:MAG: hypothetical protein RR931_01180 [Mucinivorans sp.]
MFSIPGIKGIEFGAGFEGVKTYGSRTKIILGDDDGAKELLLKGNPLHLGLNIL